MSNTEIKIISTHKCDIRRINGENISYSFESVIILVSNIEYFTKVRYKVDETGKKHYGTEVFLKSGKSIIVINDFVNFIEEIKSL